MGLMDLLFKGKKNQDAFLLLFSAEWCGPSRRLKQELLNAGVKFNIIDVEKEEELVEKFNIMSVPKTLLLDDRYNIIKIWDGYDDEDPGQTKIINYLKCYNLLEYDHQSKSYHEKFPYESVCHNDEQLVDKQESQNIHKHANLFENDDEIVCYKTEQIRSISLGGNLMLTPYDIGWFIQVPDSDILPIFFNGSQDIKKYLPGIDFSTTEACKKTLQVCLMQPEIGLGWTYVLRNGNIPIGMIFVHSPKFNEKGMNLKIWSIDFFLFKEMRGNKLMFQSLIRVLNALKTDVGVHKVYAFVDRSNDGCVNLLYNSSSPLFQELDNSGFKDSCNSNNQPRVFVIDLTRMNFVHK